MAQAKNISVMIVMAVLTLVLSSGRALAQDRGGFTAMADIGLGIQNDSAM